MSEGDINIIENFLNYNKEYLSVIEIATISKLLKAYREQQKEIEELKEMKPLQDLIDTNIIIADYSHNYISKDKIKEKIKEYQEKAEDVKQKYRGGYACISDYLEALAKIEGYQELLEENNNE